MKIIVTGAAGFIGSHLAERLVEGGDDVIGVDSFLDYYPRSVKERNLTQLRQSPRFSFLEQNLLDVNWPEILRNVDIIFHLAAQAGVRASWSKNFLIYTKNNIEATQLMLEESKNSKLKKFVFASTSSVYGDTEDIPMKENSVLKPVSPYGVTKLAAENLCFLYWKNFGVPCVSLRYFTVYGPRQRPDMGFYKFLLAILEGRPLVIFDDGNQTRDFTYYDDIVTGTILAAERGKEGASYNLGGGTRIHLHAVIKMLQDITGKEVDRQFIEKQKGDMRDTFASIDRAKEDLGYSPQTDLYTGLQQEYSWLKGLFEQGLAHRAD